MEWEEYRIHLLKLWRSQTQLVYVWSKWFSLCNKDLEKSTKWLHIMTMFSLIGCGLWQYGLWSFQTGDIKLERFLPKNQHTQRKLLNFVFWINGELSKSAKIWLSKSIFYVKNHPNLSHFFFIEEYQFRSTFFVIDIFW